MSKRGDDQGFEDKRNQTNYMVTPEELRRLRGLSEGSEVPLANYFDEDGKLWVTYLVVAYRPRDDHVVIQPPLAADHSYRLMPRALAWDLDDLAECYGRATAEAIFAEAKRASLICEEDVLCGWVPVYFSEPLDGALMDGLGVANAQLDDDE